MSKRAEEAALKAYPKEERKVWSSAFGTIEFDKFATERIAYQQGYEQAEKDTIEMACQWLFAHLPILVDYYDEDIPEKSDRSEFIKLFRTQMEGKQ